MSVLPVIAEFDWSQVFYFLIPLVYVAAQFFGGKKEKKTKPGSEGKTARTQAQEHLRKVQEEIRRKVAEHQEALRRSVEGEVERPTERSSAPPQPSEYDPNLPEWMQRRGGPTASPPPLQRRSRPEPEPTPPPVPQENSLDRQLREQRERLDRAKRERKAAFEKAREIAHVGLDKTTCRRTTPQASVRGQVLGSLGSPQSARTAIVLSEVLGPPRSMRPLEARGW